MTDRSEPVDIDLLRPRLRFLVEQITTCFDELARLRAENERLKSTIRGMRAVDVDGEAIENELEGEIKLLSATIATQAAEIERLNSNIRIMVEKAADKSLAGYRELGQKCAELENKLDAARATIKDMRAVLLQTQCSINRRRGSQLCDLQDVGTPQTGTIIGRCPRCEVLSRHPEPGA